MPISFELAYRQQQRNLFDEVLAIIADNFAPDEVFSDDALEKWALDHRYVYEKDCPEAE